MLNSRHILRQPPAFHRPESLAHNQALKSTATPPALVLACESRQLGTWLNLDVRQSLNVPKISMKFVNSKAHWIFVAALFTASFFMPVFVDGREHVTGSDALRMCATIAWDSNPPPVWAEAYLLGFVAANVAFVIVLSSQLLGWIGYRAMKIISGVSLAYVASWGAMYRLFDDSSSAHPTVGYYAWLLSFAGLFGLLMIPRGSVEAEQDLPDSDVLSS